MIAIITHTRQHAPWLKGCVDSVRANMPAGGLHHVIVDTGDMAQMRWDACQLDEFVAFVDDDDLVVNDAIAKCIDALQRTGAGVAFTDQLYIDVAGNPLAIDDRPIRYRDVMMTPQAIHHLAVMRRSALDPLVLEMANEIGWGIDWLLKSYAALRHGAVHVPIVGYHWRQHRDQESVLKRAQFHQAVPLLRACIGTWLTKDGPVPQHLQ